MEQDQKRSESILGDTAGPEAAGGEPKPKCARGALWKVTVVVVLAAAAAAVVASKANRRAVTTAAGSSAQQADAPGPDRGATMEEPADSQLVLATVNGEPITLGRLDERLSALPERYRTAFERSKHEFLEELIARELLLQQARSTKEERAVSTDSLPDGEDALIRELLKEKILDGVDVDEADLRAFYEEHKDELPGGRSLEDVKDALRPYVLQAKQQAAVEAHLNDLRLRAEIARNEAWIDAQKALAADNPLDRALQSGRPVVADFGRGTCIPCQMMKPILDELAKEYAGRAEVLIISVDEYPALTERCRIRAIPTQIFYDASGRESHRHEGFMPREDVVAGLAQMGVK